MKNAFANQPITLVFPAPVLQRDFTACGVFTIKGIRHFDKHGETFDQSLKQLVQNRSKHGQPSIPGEQKEKPEDCPPGFISLQQVKDRNIELAKKSVTEYPVLLEELPPWLLKLYQGNIDKLSSAQRSAKVDRAGSLSLENYLQSQQVQDLPKLRNSDETADINMAAFRQRYVYFKKWRERHMPGAEKPRRVKQSKAAAKKKAHWIKPPQEFSPCGRQKADPAQEPEIKMEGQCSKPPEPLPCQPASRESSSRKRPSSVAPAEGKTEKFRRTSYEEEQQNLDECEGQQMDAVRSLQDKLRIKITDHFKDVATPQEIYQGALDYIGSLEADVRRLQDVNDELLTENRQLKKKLPKQHH